MGRANVQDYEGQKRGDLAYDRYAENWEALHIGTAGQFLWVASGLPAWRTLALGDVGSVFDATAPVTQAFGDVAAAGTAATASHRDHKHGMPSFPAWTAFTPTITSGAGTFTTVAGSGAWQQLGKILHLRLLISITTNGTAATNIQFSLPNSLTANGAQALTGTTSGSIGLTAWVQTGSGVVVITKYDSTYPGADGVFPIINGVVEVA